MKQCMYVSLFVRETGRHGERGEMGEYVRLCWYVGGGGGRWFDR